MKRWLTALRPRSRILIAAAVVFVMLYMLHLESAVGNDNRPKQILLRLEDVGPGGQYEGAEQLGKLRAVLTLLKERDVQYQIAVIPRWKNTAKDGAKYDVSIDQTDNEYARSFAALLHSAARSGAVIGMHGYTHQVGDTVRQDGHQESGIGDEFYVTDVGETMTRQFASRRVEEGMETFRRAGLFPYFWEAPHYRTLPEQDAVFRNYFGLHFQADVHRNANTLYTQYKTERNEGYGSPSLGAIYVPTPFSYIPYNRDVDIIMNQLDKSDKLPSFFYHPFLEFGHLLPVKDEQGEPVIQDGLPLYRYPASEKSNLQKLLTRLADKGYSFVPITDYIPFVPAHSVKVGTGMEGAVAASDVTGDGQADIVVWDRQKGQIAVTNGQFRGLRNESSGASKVWAQLPYTKGDSWTLLDDNGDGKADLWVMRTDGTLECYRSSGENFVISRTWKTGKMGWSAMYALKRNGGEWVIAGEAADDSQLESFSIKNGELKPIEPRPWGRRLPVRLVVGDLDGDGNDSLLIPLPHSSRWIELSPDETSQKWKRRVLQLDIPTGEDGAVKIGDFNGDGKKDVLFWNREEKKFAVYRQTDPLRFELSSRMGPWGHSNGELLICDLNGDGRQDVAEMDNGQPYVDMAMSFQSKKPPASSKAQ